MTIPYVLAVLSTSATDNSAALQSAINAAQTAGVRVEIEGAPYAFTHGVTIDVAKTSLNGNGALLDFSNMAAGNDAFTITNSINNPVLMGQYSVSHPIENLVCYGPARTTDCSLFYLSPTTLYGAPWIIGTVVRGIGATGFRRFAKVGGGVVGPRFSDCWYADDGRSTGTFIGYLGGANSGEKLYFDNCFVAGVNCFICDETSSGNNVEIFCNGVSVDGVNYFLTGGSTPGANQSAITVNFNSGHIEALQPIDDYSFNIGNGGFIMNGGGWVGSFGRIHTLIHNTAAGSAPGIKLSNVVFNDAASNFQPYQALWADGGGNVTITGASALGNTQLGLFAPKNNLIALPDYPDASLFSCSGTVARDTGVYPPVGGAAASLKMTGNANAFVQVQIMPGQQISGAAYVTTSGLDGAAWHVAIQWLSASGSPIDTYTVSGSAEVSPFVRQLVCPPQKPAPAGSVYARYTLSVSGSVHNTSQVWFGYPQFNVY
jgi:hypothetical protein